MNYCYSGCRSNWWGFLGKRFLFAAVLFLLVTLLFFGMLHGVWGRDNVINIINDIPRIGPLPEADAMLVQLEKNEPRFVKYARWMGDFFTGDWGYPFLPASHYLAHYIEVY